MNADILKKQLDDAYAEIADLKQAVITLSTRLAETEKPRQYTAEEVGEMFLKHVWVLIDYWDTKKENKLNALEGLAFSILSALDGESAVLPAFMVIPMPHEQDADYYISQGENWFPPYDSENPCDIGGSLHEKFHAAGRRMKGEENAKS